MSDLPSRLRYSMALTLRFGSWERRYVCEGALGAVEFWVRESGIRLREALPDTDLYSAGFELHRATPEAGDGAPDHGRCSALSDRACWHDGSSTYGTDYWLPVWRSAPEDHQAIFRRLAGEYADRFENKEQA